MGRGRPRGPGSAREAPRRHRRVTSPQEEAKAKEEEGVPDDEGWVKVTRRGRRPVLPRTEAASLRVLEREKRKRARKELLNFYAWQHRETKMERKDAPPWGAPLALSPKAGGQRIPSRPWGWAPPTAPVLAPPCPLEGAMGPLGCSGLGGGGGRGLQEAAVEGMWPGRLLGGSGVWPPRHVV